LGDSAEWQRHQAAKLEKRLVCARALVCDDVAGEWKERTTVMKWLEKNWVVVLVVVLAYMWYNGSLGNLLGGSSAAAVPTGGTSILGG
jgi:hypothetical protein